MRHFLSVIKCKADTTFLRNARQVGNVTRGMWLIIAGLLYFYACHFESLLVRIIVAALITAFAIVARYIVIRFRELPEEDRAETYIFWQWHPYYFFACLVLFSCVLWVGVFFGNK